MLFVFRPHFCWLHICNGEGIAEDAGSFFALLLHFFPNIDHSFWSEVAENNIGIAQVGLEKVFHENLDVLVIEEGSNFGHEEGEWCLFKTCYWLISVLIGFYKEASISASKIVDFVIILDVGEFCDMLYYPHSAWYEWYFYDHVGDDCGENQAGERDSCYKEQICSDQRDELSGHENKTRNSAYCSTNKR